jgi:pimeloyl-ACP methyl ester carboxylesterase
MFRAVALLSVPYAPRGKVCPSEMEKLRYPGKIFYQAAFRAPASDAYMMSNVRMNLLNGLFSLSGEAEGDERWNPVRDPAVPSVPRTPRMPSWLSESDLDFLEAEYKRATFTGGLNYYRNMDRNWALTPFLDGAKITQPTLFIAGDRDPVIEFMRPAYDRMAANVPKLQKSVLLPGTGHWTQQERPEEVSRLLIEFLGTI